MSLRQYQQTAHDAAARYVRASIDPCLIEAPTGAGKSWIIAALAQTVRGLSGKRVLCLAPSAELVQQNREKYLTTGQPASLYSATAGKKCLKHPVIFATPGTAKKGMESVAPEIGCIVIDEAHRITPTVKGIIHKIKQWSPNVRVIGMTATPYRLGEGYIYAANEDGQIMDAVREPYFQRLVYRISAHELIQTGYLTPPNIGQVGDHYNALQLETNKRGQFDSAEVEQAFEGQGRKTAAIIGDIVAQSRDRMGVLLFSATVEHARECMASLPPGMAEMITGSTTAGERSRILAQFKAGQIKYLVNVQVLTTGFDAEHIDVVAILRATESAGLLLQIIGRGLRLHDDKHDCLILDYAENIERHAPDGDVFNPDIEKGREPGDSDPIEAVCEWCKNVNEFTPRPNPDGFDIDKHGYFLDLDGVRVSTEQDGAMPAHYGRRCMFYTVIAGHEDRCGYRWTGKTCEECGEENDIAARRCIGCKAELVDPNEKLRLDFERAKADPYTPSTDIVRSWSSQQTVSRAGNPVEKVTFVTDYNTVTIWLAPESRARAAMSQVALFRAAGEIETITYCKDSSNPKFWRILAYNRKADYYEGN